MSRGDAGNRTDLIIKQLGLEPHPERGFYRQTYRASLDVPSSTHGAARAASTAIYFLVTASEPDTYLHRLKSDEIFHLYDGGPLDILRLFPDGAWDVARLGMDLAAGERPQIVIPAGTWFGTALVVGASHGRLHRRTRVRLRGFRARGRARPGGALPGSRGSHPANDQAGFVMF